MNKKQKRPKKPKIVKVSHEQVQQLSKAIKQSDLDEEISSLVISLISGSHWLVNAIERGEMSIARLRKLLFGSQTEHYKKRREQANNNDQPDAATDEDVDTLNDANTSTTDQDAGTDSNTNKTAKPRKKGHGRLGVDAYSGANIVDVALEGLKPGDDCPTAYCDGRLYEMAKPGVLLRITGNPLAQATRYQLQKLRCNLCNAIFTASLPKGVGNKKYDESFVAMLMINKYFMSVPLYRQERLQKYLGIPLPSSTQWELMAGAEKLLSVLYQAFLLDGARAKGLSFDDTKARILEQMALNKKAASKKEKKGCYTTGVVCAHDDHLSYIFLTNNRTAGKDLSTILALRPPDLPAPYLMCDALTANIPESISRDLYILCYCLVHARRQFYELPNGYDNIVDKVIRLIGKVYDHEDHAKHLSSDQRLSYHQMHSNPVMSELKTYLEEQSTEYEPNSAAGCAIQYILKRWTELSQFLRHPDAPIDNNITERALKLVIQVRKSSLFYKTLRSAKIASYIQTALYSAAQNGLNPYEYMCALLSHADAVQLDPAAWLPWRYQATLESVDKARQEEEVKSV